MNGFARTLIALTLGIVTALASTGHADVVPASVCVKNAPVEKSCNNGTHSIVAAEETTVFFVEPAFGNFVGRIRTTITASNGQVLSNFYCDFIGDVVVDLEGDQVSGDACTHDASGFPVLEQTFTQRCYSTDLGKDTGSGRGVWTCGLTHS